MPPKIKLTDYEIELCLKLYHDFPYYIEENPYDFMSKRLKEQGVIISSYSLKGFLGRLGLKMPSCWYSDNFNNIAAIKRERAKGKKSLRPKEIPKMPKSDGANYAWKHIITEKTTKEELQALIIKAAKVVADYKGSCKWGQSTIQASLEWI